MKITFTVGPIYTKYHIAEADIKEILALSNVIRAVCQARPSGYQYMPKYKSHMWDGYISLCKGNTFPTGLMGVVNRALPLGLQVVVNDNLQYPMYDGSTLHPNMFQGIELRPYQLDAAAELLHAKRGIAKMATNSGKTEVIAAMCKALQCDVMVLTTKVDLLYQTSERLHLRLGEVVGVVGDGHNNRQRITVGMIQTLSKQPKLDYLFDVGCIIYDEVHHLPSKTSQQVMLGIPALMRFGLSGTPLRHDDLNDLQLMAATGDVLIEVTNDELIKSGISAEPIISMVTVDDTSHYDLDYTDAVDMCIVNNPDRNDMIIKHASEASGVVLILVERLEHGRLLQEQLPGSVFLNGGFAGDDRLHYLNAMRDGKLKIVIATPIFDEGVDVPAIDTLILAGGGVSPVRLLQRLGRGMRRKSGDNILHVIDFVDATNKHLINHSRLRAQTYESEGFHVQLVDPPAASSIQ